MDLNSLPMNERMKIRFALLDDTFVFKDEVNDMDLMLQSYQNVYFSARKLGFNIHCLS